MIGAIGRHARARPTAAAIVPVGPDGVAGRAVTYGEFEAALARLAGRAAGVVPAGGVMIVRARNSPAMVAWVCAGLTAGLKVLPTHPRLTAAELGAACTRAGAGLVVADDDNEVAGPLPAVLTEAAFEGVVSRPASGRAERTIEPVDGAAILLLSSGSTGAPKLVQRDLAALDAMGFGGAAALGLTPEDRVAACVPLHHSYGVDLLLATLTAGAALVTFDRFDAAALAALLASGGASVLPGVPFMFEALSRVPPAGGPGAGHGVRLAVSAGSPLPRAVRERMAAAWTVRVTQLYGASELGTVALRSPDDPCVEASCVGRPLPGVSVRVLGKNAGEWTECAAGSEGQVAVRAPSMLSGYFPGQPAPLVDGHLLTGDLGRLDAEGRLHITGRVRLLIDVGGTKVNPVEVEAALGEHAGVRECLVTGLALSETVTRLHALVVPVDAAAPPSAESLRAFLKGRLAPFKIPRVFEIVAALPRSAAGKVLRPGISGGGDS